MSWISNLAEHGVGGDDAPDMVIAARETDAVWQKPALFMIFGAAARIAPLVMKIKRMKLRPAGRPPMR